MKILINQTAHKTTLKALLVAGAFAVGISTAAIAFAQSAPNDAEDNLQKAAPLEMLQLQAQVDAMLDEMDELQGYKACGELGLIFDPRDSNANDDGCVEPETPTLEAPRIVGGELAPTAKSFKLGKSPKATEGGENIPLKALNASQPTPMKTIEPVKPVAANSVAKPSAPASQPRAVEEVPAIDADYPSDRVRAVVEMAVAQALKGAQNTDLGAGEVIQPNPAVVNAPIEGAENKAATSGAAAAGLVPSCAEGEFLTVMGGEVVCRRAASAGKMACPPAVLRTYVDWHDQHIHFHVPYTPHGQQRTTQEKSDILKVECNNGTYKMVEITRNECGGGTCQEGRKPAYSMTYYCNQDKTNRCYAKQNGHLVNHTYTKSYINKQY